MFTIIKPFYHQRGNKSNAYALYHGILKKHRSSTGRKKPLAFILHLPQLHQKLLRRFREHLILLPQHEHWRLILPGKGTETQLAVPAGIDDLVKGQRVAHALFHHQGAVIEQVEGAHHVQFFLVAAQPLFLHCPDTPR